MADVFPPRDLPGRAEEWGRQVERRIESGEASEQQLEQKVDNGLRAAGGQLAVLARQIDEVSRQQDYLFELQRLDVAETSTTQTITSGNWMTGQLEIDTRTETGRIEILYGGSGNNGSGYFVYSISSPLLGTLVDRNDVVSNPAKRVAISGGASFSPSGFTTDVVDVPPGILLNVKLEVQSAPLAVNNFFFVGGRLLVRSAPPGGWK